MTKRSLTRSSALALPFLIGIIGLRLAVAPAGDAIAGSLAWIPRPAPARPSQGLPSTPGPVGSAEVSSSPVGDDEGDRRIASRSGAPERAPHRPGESRVEEAKDKDAGAEGAARAGSPSDAAEKPRATIVVPAAVVTRALERRDVGATNATSPDGTPLGARLVGVGNNRTGLRDGDVVISVGGGRTPTVDAMVGAAMQVATTGAARISGRIVRGDATFAVVVELPK